MNIASEIGGASSSSSKQERKIFGAFMASDHQIPQNHQNINQMLSFGMLMQSASSSPSQIPGSFNINKDGGAYQELGELDQALFEYLDVQNYSSAQEQRQNSGMRPHTLNIFPSQPMHVVDPSEIASKGHAGILVSETSVGFSHPTNYEAGSSAPPEPAKVVKRETNRKMATSSSEQEPKTPDPKTLRRLAQNREAARKSRLRKKAYVQQLESSRMRLAQLEQEIQRTRNQGIYLGGNANIAGDPALPVAMMANNIASADAALFDMGYSRWVEEHSHQTDELRRAVGEHSSEHELHIMVNNLLELHDQLIELKGIMVKSDVFHIISGVWKTPAERCFLWMGGFRPSHLIKIISGQIEAMTDQQVIAMYGLQQSTQEAEEALSQGIEALNNSITQNIAYDTLTFPPLSMNNYSDQMAIALHKLTTLEDFIRQGDSLRQQTLRRLRQILSTHQAARCFLAIGEYFSRLRALSSLWVTRPIQHD